MSSPKSTLKFLAGAFIIFVAAAGGMYLGGVLVNKPGASANQDDIFTNLTLGPGVEFPDVELLDGKYLPVKSRSLLNEGGTVVLFMDDDCPPCGDIAADWQMAIERGEILPIQVVGICFANAAQIHSIHGKYQIDFQVFADERYVFLDYYGVDAFPLILIVNKSGVITFIETNSNNKIDKDDLKRHLNG